MCIMEVRPGQHTSTIAQACAHNVSTIERDLDMFELLVAARGESELLAMLRTAHEHLRHAYADLLEVFGEEIGRIVSDPASHVHSEHDHAQHAERTLIAQAHHDAGLARKFETR